MVTSDVLPIVIDGKVVEKGLYSMRAAHFQEGLYAITHFAELLEGPQAFCARRVSFEACVSTRDVCGEVPWLAGPLELMAFGILHPAAVEGRFIVAPKVVWSPVGCGRLVLAMSGTSSGLVFHSLPANGPWGPICEFLELS